MMKNFMQADYDARVVIPDEIVDVLRKSRQESTNTFWWTATCFFVYADLETKVFRETFTPIEIDRLNLMNKQSIKYMTYQHFMNCGTGAEKQGIYSRKISDDNLVKIILESVAGEQFEYNPHQKYTIYKTTDEKKLQEYEHAKFLAEL